MVESNIALIKPPLQEFEVVMDSIDMVVVLTCWKLISVREKLEELFPSPDGMRWVFHSKLQHPDNDNYYYIWHTLAREE